MDKTISINEFIDKESLISIYTSGDSLRFKTKKPESSLEYIQNIFSEDFFSYTSPDETISAIIRTSLIIAITVSDEEPL